MLRKEKGFWKENLPNGNCDVRIVSEELYRVCKMERQNVTSSQLIPEAAIKSAGSMFGKAVAYSLTPSAPMMTLVPFVETRERV